MTGAHGKGLYDQVKVETGEWNPQNFYHSYDDGNGMPYVKSPTYAAQEISHERLSHKSTIERANKADFNINNEVNSANRFSSDGE